MLVSADHCRIGSLEMEVTIMEQYTLGSLPHRQLRNHNAIIDAMAEGSLPHRQLRKMQSLSAASAV